MIVFGYLPASTAFNLSSDGDFYQAVATASGASYPVGATMVLKWLNASATIIGTWSATIVTSLATFNEDKTVVAALLALTPIQGRVFYQDVTASGPELLIAKGSVRDISP